MHYNLPECYMTQKMCDKTVNAHPSAIKFVPEYWNTQEKSDKDDSIPDRYKTLEMCHRVVSEDPY